MVRVVMSDFLCMRDNFSVTFLVTKRRNSEACRGNPNPEQETIKGTHTHKKRQRTNAGQPHSTRRKEANPQLGTAHAASEDTTHTSNHTACHQSRKRRPARHPPWAQQVPHIYSYLNTNGTCLAATKRSPIPVQTARNWLFQLETQPVTRRNNQLLACADAPFLAKTINCNQAILAYVICKK